MRTQMRSRVLQQLRANLYLSLLIKLIDGNPWSPALKPSAADDSAAALRDARDLTGIFLSPGGDVWREKPCYCFDA